MNTVLTLVSWFLPLAVAFVATPILIRNLGNELYGLYTFSVSFLAYAFVSGLGRISSKYVPEFRAANSQPGVDRSVSATFYLTTIVGAAQALLVAGIAAYLVRDVLFVSQQFQTQTINSLYFAAAAGFVMMAGQVFFYALQGVHRFGIFTLLTIINGLLISIGNIVLTGGGFGITAMLAWNLAVVAITGTAAFYYSFSRFNIFRFTISIDRPLLREILRYGGSIFIYQALGCALILFERSLIVRKFGAQELPHYVVPMMLALYMHGALAAMLSVVFPYVNELLNEPQRLSEVYLKASKGVTAVVFLCVCGFFTCGHYFLELWLGRDFADAAYQIFIIHGITYGLSAIALVVWHFAEALKVAALNAACTIVWVVSSAPLMIAAAEYSGMKAVAFARLSGLLLTMPIIPFFEHRFMGGVKWKFWSEVLIKLVLASVVMAAATLGILSILPFGWATFIAAAFSGTVVFGATLLAVGFASADEKAILRGAFGRFIKK